MSNYLLCDATSVFAFHQLLKDRDFPVQGNPDYSSLVGTIQGFFPSSEFEAMMAFTAINFENEGQRKFTSFLQRLGFIVDATDYRDAFVLPDKSSQYQRLSTRITYVAGMLCHKKPHFVVVTDAFDTYYPLLDLAQTRGCKISLAFFRSALESRWHRVGLFGEDSPISFIDLDPFSKEIVGADVAPVKSQSAPAGRTGLSGIRI